MAEVAAMPAAPEQLVARVQELQERLEAVAGDAATRDGSPTSSSRRWCRCTAPGWSGSSTLLAGADADQDGRQIAASLSEDELVATLLLIHDLHPVPLADRVQAALDSVRPYMESHGGNVELVSLRDGVATIHLRGSCSDCSASAVTLELAIKQALEEAAPDLEALEVLGVAAQTAGGPGLPMVSGSVGGRAPTSGMELPVVMAGVGGDRVPQPAWVDLESVAGLADGTLAAVSVAGSDLVVANVDGTSAGLPRPLCQLRRAAARGAAVSGRARLPGVSALVLPAPGRSLARR